MDRLVNIESIFTFFNVPDINGLNALVSTHKYSSQQYKR